MAILFTDLVGSTDAVARLGDEGADRLRQAHFALLREVIGECAGTEVKNLGDGLMVAFAAASDAVTGAVAMQQAVERANGRSSEPLGMRVGLAAGAYKDIARAQVVEAGTIPLRPGTGTVAASYMLAPGSASGWRTFGGPSILAVTSGTLTLARAEGCASKEYPAGVAVVAPAGAIAVSNTAEEPVGFSAWFFGLPPISASRWSMGPRPHPVRAGRWPLTPRPPRPPRADRR